MLENPDILKKYILAQQRHIEYLVPLYFELSAKVDLGNPPTLPARVVAVYRPTGRGPFRIPGTDNTEGWEYEYQGVRIV